MRPPPESFNTPYAHHKCYRIRSAVWGPKTTENDAKTPPSEMTLPCAVEANGNQSPAAKMGTVNETPVNCRPDELLLRLSGLDEAGVPLIELPAEFLKPDLMTVFHADRLIEFVRRRHCRVGTGNGELRLETGWEVTGNVMYPDHSLASDVVRSVIADDVETPELRVRVRLTNAGEIQASRIRLRNSPTMDAKPATSVQTQAETLAGGDVDASARLSEPDTRCLTEMERRVNHARYVNEHPMEAYLELSNQFSATLGEMSQTLSGVSESEFVFRPDGDGYFLKGFGESGHVTAKGAKGLCDLFRLVQTPGKPVPMLELDAGPGVERAEGDGRSRQPIADGVTFQQLAAKRKQLKADIANANPNTPDGQLELAETQAELDRVEVAAKGLKGLNGTPRDLNNPNNRRRSNIHGRIETACKKLKDAQLSRLADHFALTCSAEGAFYVYTPGIPNLTWNTTEKQ